MTPKNQKASLSKKAKTESNEELANLLLEIGQYERYMKNQFYKYNAYRKAAQSILDYPNKISSIDDVKDLEGIGKKIFEKIKEYLEKGKIEDVEKIRKDKKAKVISELTKVSGIGPAAAAKFYKEGIKSVDELRSNQDKLNHAQKIGLKYFEDLKKPIPRSEMIQMEEFIVKSINFLDKNYIVTLCGSYRRGAESSDNVDVLIAHPNYVSTGYARENNLKRKPGLIISSKSSPKPLIEKVVKELTRLQFISDTMTFGEAKFMGVAKLNDKFFRELNLILIPYDQYYCGLLYFTGSEMFNKKLRKQALEKGFTMNQYSLRKLTPRGVPGKALQVNSEMDIFKHIGLPYVKPEDRNTV